MIWNTLPEHIRNSSFLTFFRKQLKITCTATDWFTGFLFGLILIIVGCSIQLRLVVSVWCCVLTITSLMLILWSETEGNVLLLLLSSEKFMNNNTLQYNTSNLVCISANVLLDPVITKVYSHFYCCQPFILVEVLLTNKWINKWIPYEFKWHFQTLDFRSHDNGFQNY